MAQFKVSLTEITGKSREDESGKVIAPPKFKGIVSLQFEDDMSAKIKEFCASLPARIMACDKLSAAEKKMAVDVVTYCGNNGLIPNKGNQLKAYAALTGKGPAPKIVKDIIAEL